MNLERGSPKSDFPIACGSGVRHQTTQRFILFLEYCILTLRQDISSTDTEATSERRVGLQPRRCDSCYRAHMILRNPNPNELAAGWMAFLRGHPQTIGPIASQHFVNRSRLDTLYHKIRSRYPMTMV